MSGFEENEISKNANGGTEIAKRKLASIIDPSLLEHFQIICSRPRELEIDKIRLFWCHDLPEDPESKKFADESWRNSLHKLIFISNWQYQRYQIMHNVPYDQKSIILESGIEAAPENVFDMKDKEKIRITYTSTPQRGLEILVPVFAKLAETNPNIHLDVYSSFKIYGWDEIDSRYEPLYDVIRNHPQMTYHGFVPNQDLKDYLNIAHIFAYPSIWIETSCRAMLEAMSAGLVCVHPNYGALAETSGSLNVMYHGTDLDKVAHANIFASNLNSAIKFVSENQQGPMTRFNKVFVDSRYNLDKIKYQWEAMLRDMLNKYPTVESRGMPKKTFIYRT